LFSLIYSQQPTLYAIFTEFAGDLTETVMWTGKVDLKNGAITNLVENFIYAGGSVTVDGISCFDSSTLTYYYVTDGDNAFVYSANVKNKQLLAPIDFYSAGVMNINYDTNQKQLLVSMLNQQNTPVLVSFPQTRGWSVVLTYPSTPQFSRSEVDSVGQFFYWVSFKPVNNTWSNKWLNKISLSSPTQVQTVMLQCTAQKITIYPQRLIWDPTKKQLFSAGISFDSQNQLHYWVEKIDMNGNCQQTEIQLLQPGIIVAYSYDNKLGSLYFSMATNNGGFIYNAAVTTGKINGNGIHVGQNLLAESIEFAYV